MTWNENKKISSDRLTNFTVSILDKNGNTVYTTDHVNAPNPSIAMNVANLVGRTVRVQLKGVNPLSLAEVLVYGESAGNGSGSGGGGDISCDVYNYENFEDQNPGIWNDGGGDADFLNVNGRGVNGEDQVARLRDNSGAASSIFTDALPFSNVTEIEVDFAYTPSSMETREDFLLEISTNNGSSWNTAQTWVVNEDFNNEQLYAESVTIEGSFTNTTRLRFRCDASGNGDLIYLDNIEISTCSSSGLVGGDVVENIVGDEDLEVRSRSDEQKPVDVRVYPNPVSSSSGLKLNVDISNHMEQAIKLALRDVKGQQILAKDLDSDHQSVESLDLSQLIDGIYILFVRTQDQEVIVKKIILKR